MAEPSGWDHPITLILFYILVETFAAYEDYFIIVMVVVISNYINILETII